MCAFPEQTYAPAAIKNINNVNKTWRKHTFPVNSTLTLTPTQRDDKTFSTDHDSVSLWSVANVLCVSHNVCHTMCVSHTVSCLVKGRTVSQQIPLDPSSGRAWGFVHLWTAIIVQYKCIYLSIECVCTLRVCGAVKGPGNKCVS